jgi:hypothetical protein
MNTTTEYPPRHIQGFRPLVPGEAWHRTDYTPDMLPEGWRPLMLGEIDQKSDEVLRDTGWRVLGHYPSDTTGLPTWESTVRCRTRRPLPPPPPTFEHDGKVWTSHVPGDPCPVDERQMVECLMFDGDDLHCQCQFCEDWYWGVSVVNKIIGYRIPEAEPVNDTAKLRERIAELEQQLATALTPRPISEAGGVKEGFRRWYLEIGDSKMYSYGTARNESDTHFIDIRLPEPDPRAEYERALAECGGDPVALYAKMKGGAK